LQKEKQGKDYQVKIYRGRVYKLQTCRVVTDI